LTAAVDHEDCGTWQLCRETTQGGFKIGKSRVWVHGYTLTTASRGIAWLGEGNHRHHGRSSWAGVLHCGIEGSRVGSRPEGAPHPNRPGDEGHSLPANFCLQLQALIVTFATMTRLDDLRSTLTDAGHTVVGFATIAAKKAADLRQDFVTNVADRTEVDERLVATVKPFIGVARQRAFQLVSTMEDVTAGIDARIDPMVDAATDRLPNQVAKPVHEAVVELRRVRTEVRGRAHDIADKVFSAPAVKTTRASASTTKPTTTAGKFTAATATPKSNVTTKATTKTSAKAATKAAPKVATKATTTAATKATPKAATKATPKATKTKATTKAKTATKAKARNAA
jgi:hypothetical protein